MNSQPSRVPFIKRRTMWIICVFLLPLLIQGLGCNFSAPEEDQVNDQEATSTALQATIDNQSTQAAKPTETQAAAPAQQQTQAPPPPPTTGPRPTGQQPPAGDIEDKIKSASILLFEDMAGNPEVFPYVVAALDRLGLQAQNTGDAQGRFFDAMQRADPTGKPWDLIIVASEDRDGIQGDIFSALEKNIQQGTAVIIEAWHLTQISEGTIKPILLRCGVTVGPYFASDDLAYNLYPQDPNHPLLNEVTKVNEFRKLVYYPGYGGDLQYQTGTGDAQIVLSTKTDTPGQNGVLTECMKGQMVLQSFSSHNYTDDTMVPLWANYIHYVLRKHFGG